MSKKSVLLLSGGIDSSTLLYYLIHAWRLEVYPLSILYGQRHSKELIAAQSIVDSMHLKLQVIDLSALKPIFSASSLTNTSQDIPEGHYEAKSMESTVVPNRNMILLSIAAAYAQNIGAKFVHYAAHKNDFAIYPDCRPDFVEAMVKTLQLSTGVSLVAPFLHKNKADIVKIGLKLDVPYGKTWSCYNGRDKACGRCGTCTERRESFALNNAKDPIQYE